MLEIGKTATAKTIVSDANTAKAVGSGSLDVFATPMMIALMEKAACEVLADSLEEGQTSVGTQANITHIAASPVGMEITATATIESISGREVKFTVTANDSVGEIGNGTHARFIVDEARFMEKTNMRK